MIANQERGHMYEELREQIGAVNEKIDNLKVYL